MNKILLVTGPEGHGDRKNALNSFVEPPFSNNKTAKFVALVHSRKDPPPILETRDRGKTGPAEQHLAKSG